MRNWSRLVSSQRTSLAAAFVGAAILILTSNAVAVQPSITVTPTTMVTLQKDAFVEVSGAGFAASQAVVIWLDTDDNGRLDDGEPAAVVGSSQLGVFANAQLMLRDIPAGVHRIQAAVCPGIPAPPTAVQGGGLCLGTTGVASAQFELDFSVTPATFGSGTTVTVTGLQKSLANSTVNIWFDGNNNAVRDNGETSVTTTSDGNGAFAATLLIKSSPGHYQVAAGPSTAALVAQPIGIGTCWFQECFIDDAMNICLIGDSPSDFGSFFADCKQIDSNYSKPVPATLANVPPGGYPINPITGEITNKGPRFLGAAVLAAALNDLDLPGTQLLGPLNPACIAINAALINADATFHTDVPEGGFDFFKPGNLADITCGGAFGGTPPSDLVSYIGAQELVGNDVPDKLLIGGAVAAINAGAVAAGAAVAAASAGALAVGPLLDAVIQAAVPAAQGAGLDPGTAAALGASVGPAIAEAVTTAGFVGGIAAAVVTPAVLLVAQNAVAQAAVAAAVACGHVDYYCDGADITATILSDPSNAKRNPPDLQNQLMPLSFFQPPIKPVPAPPAPNPCTQVNGNCWGGTIGWAKVACTVVSSPFDSDGNGVCEQSNPNKDDYLNQLVGLPVPGSAGPNNVNAPEMCATGKVIGLSIGYDGDTSFDVTGGPSVWSLTNYHNFKPGPGGSEPPNGIDIEIPLKNPTNDPNLKLSTDPDLHAILIQLRPGMMVRVCGHWVADMDMLWNELHPVTSLVLEPDFTLAAAPSDVTLQAGETATITMTTTLNSGPAPTVSLTVLSALPVGASATFSQSNVTPTLGMPKASTLTISNLPVGDYTLTIQGESNDIDVLSTLNLHVYDYTLAIAPANDTALRGASASYAITSTLVPNSSTTNLPTVQLAQQGLPGDANASYTLGGITPGSGTTLKVVSALNGSLGDFGFTVSTTNPSATVRTSNVANLHLYDFSVSTIPPTLQVLTTGSNSDLVAVALVPQSTALGLPAIDLSLSGLPGNTVAGFTPGSGTVGFSSTLAITTSHAAASPGVTLTITGTDARSPEGGARSTNLTLVVLTPAQALTLLIHQVGALGLNQGQSNSMITKLTQAIAGLNSKPPGNPSACNQLNALINEINGYVMAGLLTPAQADTLLRGPLGILAIKGVIPC